MGHPEQQFYFFLAEKWGIPPSLLLRLCSSKDITRAGLYYRWRAEKRKQEAQRAKQNAGRRKR